MKILQLTVHYPPNTGGVETHLGDLVGELVKKKYEVFVLAYQPLVAQTSWKIWEERKNLKILRLPWIRGLYYKTIYNSISAFIYTFPGLFFALPFVLFLFNPDVIHSHGIVAGFAAVFWGKIFGKKVITTTHSIYNFPKEGLYRRFSKWIFGNSDAVLTLSKQSKKEIVSLGVDEKKIQVFTYWVDLKKFNKVKDAKKKLKWQKKFVILYVGRLVAEKGIYELLSAAKSWSKKITLAVAGAGPLEEYVRETAKESWNILFLGRIDQEKIPQYFSASDLLIVPSVSEEGFGRVILESLACGTPVIGANRGAIPEAMDETVGKLIDVTPRNIKKAVEFYYKNPRKLNSLAKKTRKFALRRYSSENIKEIIQAYG